MQYVKVNVVLEPYDETTADILIAQMGEIGFDSFEETDNGFIGYAPEKDFNKEQLSALNPILDNVKMHYSIEIVPDEDWNKEWEKNYFNPITIGGKCRIRSPFHEPDTNFAYEVIINPQMSFGTGYHETTTMMVEYLLDKNITGLKVLDMGCGTGILGIIASMRGANSIDCVDIDEWCYHNTIENTSLNNISNITTKLGGAEILGNEAKYDLVIANINRNILVRDMPHYASVLKKGGAMMLSGFYTIDASIVKNTAERFGLQCVETKVLNDWNGLYLVKA